jgi:hypothetical protein
LCVVVVLVVFMMLSSSRRSLFGFQERGGASLCFVCFGVGAQFL